LNTVHTFQHKNVFTEFHCPTECDYFQSSNCKMLIHLPFTECQLFYFESKNLMLFVLSCHFSCHIQVVKFSSICFVVCSSLILCSSHHLTCLLCSVSFLLVQSGGVSSPCQSKVLHLFLFFLSCIILKTIYIVHLK